MNKRPNIFIRIWRYFTYIDCIRCKKESVPPYEFSSLYNDNICQECGEKLMSDSVEAYLKEENEKKQREHNRLVKAIKQAIVEINNESKNS